MNYQVYHNRASVFLRNNYLLILIFLLGLGLRVYNLGSESIWFDEAVSVAASKLGFLEQIRWSLDSSDNNPPLYYAFLRVWVLVFGDSELAVRLPSAIFGSFSILLIYIVAALLLNRKAALLSALILAVSVFHIKFSQEGRAYALTAFLALLSYHFFLKGVAGRKRLNSIGYVISSALLIYAHYYGLFIVLSQNIFCVGHFVTRRKTGVPGIREWIALQLILGIICIPGLYILYRHSIGIQNNFWLSPPTLNVLYDCFELYSGSVYLLILFAALSVLAVTGAGGTGVLRHFGGIFKPPAPSPGEAGMSYAGSVFLLLLWLSVPAAVPFLISLVSTPIFFYRYTIAGSLAFYILASCGAVMSGDRRFVLLVAGFILIFSSVNILAYYERVDKPDWRGGVNYIESNAGAGDVIVLYPWYETEPAAYYSGRDDLTIVSLGDEFYAASGAGDKEFWLVLCDRWLDDVGHTKGTVEKRIGESYDVLERKDFPYLYIYRLKQKKSE